MKSKIATGKPEIGLSLASGTRSSRSDAATSRYRFVNRPSRYPQARVTVCRPEECAGKANPQGESPEKRFHPRAESHRTSAPTTPGDLPALESQMRQRLFASDSLHLAAPWRARAIREGSVRQIGAGQPTRRIGGRRDLRSFRRAL